MIELNCPKCRELLVLDDGFSGGICRCQFCKAMVSVPAGRNKKPQAVAASQKPKNFPSASGELAQAHSSVRPGHSPEAESDESGSILKSPVLWTGVGVCLLVIGGVALVRMFGTNEKEKPASPAPAAVASGARSASPDPAPALLPTLDQYRKAIPEAGEKFLVTQMNKGRDLTEAAKAWEDEKKRTGWSPPPVAKVSAPAEPGQTVKHLVTAMNLVSVKTGKVIRPLKNGDTIDLAKIEPFSVVVQATKTTKSVQFLVNGKPERSESGVPFCLTGDTGGKPHPWSPAAGEYHLAVRPYPQANVQGTSGNLFEIRFSVVSGN